MRKLLIIPLLFIHILVFANMANPVIEGTLGGLPFVNQYVDVLHEDLFIEINKNFEFARFNVKYHFKSSKAGMEIPFLFYASEYLDSFSVKIDNKEVVVRSIPDAYKIQENTKFKDFSYFFEKASGERNSSVLLEDSPTGGFYVNLRDMIYFETDISEGEHIIEVNYRAAKWTDSGDWVNNYSFRYALSPAKYWKSFGTLNVELDGTKFGKQLNTNLGKPISGDVSSKAIWNFDKLPTEILRISYNPSITPTAQSLIKVGPANLAFLTGILLAILHLILLVRYRKKHLTKKFSIVVIIGSIIVPLICVVSWIYYYDLIDSFIGEHASHRHGYFFLMIGLYPIIMPVYWVVYWLIDKRWKKKLVVNN